MNINVTSSMKYINLDGLTTAQIIQKYDELLFQRENILNQLSIQLNESQEKYIEVSEKINLLTNRNKELNENKIKCDKALKKQRTDKDLLFIKLNNLMNENDKLKNIISGKKEFIPQQINANNNKEKNNEIKKIKKDKTLYESLKPEINKEQKNNVILNNNKNNNIDIIKNKNESPKNKEIIDIKTNDIKEKSEEKKEIIDKSKNIEIINEINEIKIEKTEDKELNKENKEEKKEEEINNKTKEEKETILEKKEKDKIKNDIINEEKASEVNEIKNEEKKEEEKKEENNKNKVVENEEEKKESTSEKKVIVINPEDYLNRKKKKKKHGKGGGKKLLSEKISYEPVFK